MVVLRHFFQIRSVFPAVAHRDPDPVPFLFLGEPDPFQEFFHPGRRFPVAFGQPVVLRQRRFPGQYQGIVEHRHTGVGSFKFQESRERMLFQFRHQSPGTPEDLRVDGIAEGDHQGPFSHRADLGSLQICR